MNIMLDLEFTELTSRLDLPAFWAENEHCLEFDTPASVTLQTPAINKPRCALTFSPDDHWLFELLNVPSTVRYYHDKPYRDDLHRQANALTRQYVGRTFFDEDTWEHNPRRIENLFACEFTYTEGSTPWLTPATKDPEEFTRILDRAEATNLAEWVFPELFLREWEQRKTAGKPLPLLGGGSRGPGTIMTSILPIETVFYWIYDQPQWMHRLRDLLMRKMIELNRVLRAFSGTDQPGWWITDDNSALFNRRLYHEYCFPVLAAVLDAFAPNNAYRYQHSDSSMGHLLDEQHTLGINSVNYGPDVDAALIRQKLPEAVINGQLPPLLLRNGTPDEIRQRIRTDFEKAGLNGKMVVTTAGSLAAGTSLGRMRWMMQCVQVDCRYNNERSETWNTAY
jgi:uroporphyrinogen decarboxylase